LANPDRLKKVVKIILGFAITLFAGYLFVKTSDWSEVGRLLTRINPLVLLAGGAICLISFYLRGLRWAWLLPDVPGTVRE